LPGHVAERLRGISHDGYFRLTLLLTGACSPASGGDSPASGQSTIGESIIGRSNSVYVSVFLWV
jgi:hypothetical protein|tara:strand:- start:20 stop:211 length:192 start_codon:yes stop_codon:yes gene_type:complete